MASGLVGFKGNLREVLSERLRQSGCLGSGRGAVLTCMKKPDSRAFWMFSVFSREPNAGSA